jgi:hypothetical protein
MKQDPRSFKLIFEYIKATPVGVFMCFDISFFHNATFSLLTILVIDIVCYTIH